jgi:hypothetical protein
MGPLDRTYLLARAAEERQRAAAAANSNAREVHLRLAHEYEVRANIETVTERADNDVLGVVTSDDDRSFPHASEQRL